MRQYELKIKIQDEGLIFVISGQIDTMNVADLYADFQVIRDKCVGGNLVFDCNDLSYISSAGLRFFLSVNKREKGKIRLINVSPYVYERFEIAGFTEFFDVEKSLREVFEEEVQKIGSSGDIEIYQTNEDLLMKVYPDGTDLKGIEAEREVSHAMHSHGIPALISFDVVKYQDRYGLLYERLEVQSVASAMKENPDKEKIYALAMGNLLKQIHSVELSGNFPKLKDLNKSFAHEMEKWLTYDEVAIIVDLINSIPEKNTVLYYYFNPENIFLHKNELILINMANIRVGNPLHDLARCYHPYQRMPEFWQTMLFAYFGTNNIKRKEKTIEAGALLGMSILPASHKFFRGTDMSEEKITHCIELIRRELFPNVKQIASLLSRY